MFCRGAHINPASHVGEAFEHVYIDMYNYNSCTGTRILNIGVTISK